MIKAEVIPSDKRINVRHLTKYARTQSRAAVMLGNVTLTTKAVGNLTGEYEDEITWDSLELPEAIKSRFRTARYSSKGWFDSKTKKPLTQAQAMVVLGNSHYYLP